MNQAKPAAPRLGGGDLRVGCFQFRYGPASTDLAGMGRSNLGAIPLLLVLDRVVLLDSRGG